MSGFKYPQTLKGSSLFYTLVIASILGVLCTALISFVVLQQQISNRANLREKLLLNIDSGIELLLAGHANSNKIDSIDLYSDLQDSVILIKKQWGALNLNSVKAIKGTGFGKNEFSKTFFSGHKPRGVEKAGIYLKSTDGALFVAGSTLIKGDALLPDKGIQAGYVHREGFNGKKLIEGKVGKSKMVLPEINQNIINWIGNQIARINSRTDFSYPPDSLNRSFNESTVFISGKEFYLNSEFLKGNIILRASEKITVGLNTFLEDIILIAPVIEFEEGFSGTVQAFANQKITIPKNVLLQYPSVIGLISTVQNFSSPSLNVDENSEIEGFVIGYQKDTRGQFPIRMKFEKGSLITGRVYCSGSVEPYGKISGNITCGSFLLKRKGTNFSNYLFDAQIDATDLSDHSLFAPINHNSSAKNEIMKWLD